MESVSVVDEPLILRTIEICEDDRLDFAEAFLVTCAESTGIGKVASFDPSIDRVRSIERIELQESESVPDHVPKTCP
jgi:predicted nucleic acid-binding protein